jgi:hypothetical protein
MCSVTITEVKLIITVFKLGIVQILACFECHAAPDQVIKISRVHKCSPAFFNSIAVEIYQLFNIVELNIVVIVSVQLRCCKCSVKRTIIQKVSELWVAKGGVVLITN